MHDRAFLTVNHPSNAVIETLAKRVLVHLSLNPAIEPPQRELLGSTAAPVDWRLAEALGLSEARVGKTWTIGGKRVAEQELWVEHLAWYRRRPEVVDAGIRQHGDRMAALGLID